MWMRKQFLYLDYPVTVLLLRQQWWRWRNHRRQWLRRQLWLWMRRRQRLYLADFTAPVRLRQWLRQRLLLSRRKKQAAPVMHRARPAMLRRTRMQPYSRDRKPVQKTCIRNRLSVDSGSRFLRYTDCVFTQVRKKTSSRKPQLSAGCF